MIRECKHCGQRNRVATHHLSDRGRCGACKQPLPPLDEPVDADPQLFDQVLAEAKVPVLVDFWADYCQPCHKAAPLVANLAKAKAGQAIVLKVNTQHHPGLAARYGVHSIPAFVVLRNGRVVRQQAGLVDASRLNALLS